MSAITAKASRKMKKYAVLTREPRCFLGSFDFSWEQRKLGDIASDMVAGGDIDKDLILAEGQYPVIANALTGDGIVGYYDKEYRVNAPAVTVTGRGDVGHAKARLVNFTPVVRLLSVKSEHDVFFLENAINTLKIVIESTGVPQLTVPQLAKYEVAFPRQLDEEEHIGAFFKQLDHLITLHQRKCALLFSSFQALIAMMFTTSTFSWEQRKLGDIGKARSGVGFPDADQGGLTGVPFFKVSDMNSDGNENEMTVANNYVTAEQIADHRWSPITELPAIFFAKVGAAVMLNRKRLCRFPFLLDNNTMAYSLSQTKWDADFAKALFGTVDLTSLVQVGALPSYNAGDVESMEIYLPSLLEQEQIGAYFKRLDHLITLHQRKPFLMKWRTSDANRNQTNRLVL